MRPGRISANACGVAGSQSVGRVEILDDRRGWNASGSRPRRAPRCASQSPTSVGGQTSKGATDLSPPAHAANFSGAGLRFVSAPQILHTAQ
jgi:hypothetical protein